MARFEVERTAETVVTVSDSTAGTARSSARRKLRESLRATEPDGGTFSVEHAEVYEQPAAPFEPYRIAVRATLRVELSSDDDRTARGDGAERIDSWLAASDLDGYEYAGEPAVADV